MLVQSAFKDCTISTVPITCDFKSECLSGQAVPWECDWGSLLCVILKFLPLTKQKAVRSCQHFSLVLVVAPYANMLVIPPMAGLRHPVNDVIIGKSDNKSPSFTDLCYITVNLM